MKNVIGTVMTRIGDDGKEHLLSGQLRALQGAEHSYHHVELAVFYSAEQNHSYT
jgi:hypothetical protein